MWMTQLFVLVFLPAETCLASSALGRPSPATPKHAGKFGTEV